MSKSSITWLFFAAILALAVGCVVAAVTIVAAIAGGVIVIGGANGFTIHGEVFTGSLPWLLIAALAFTAGTVAAFVAWIGALFNTYRLDDKAWFFVLLVLGLFSLGWVAMIAYVIAGPDSTRPEVARPGVATTPST
jgi:hypothetical protein